MLLLLAEEPRNGYQIIQELESRSGGGWRASAGSVYPGLQQLDDEGLVRAEESGGRKLFHLTDEGRAAVDALPADQPPPWEAMAGDVDDQRHATVHLVRQVAGATMQVIQAGTEAQVKEAGRILTDARRALYRLLAEDEPRDDAE
jgi:DNA-binding PadR family transcriptional regulator